MQLAYPLRRAFLPGRAAQLAGPDQQVKEAFVHGDGFGVFFQQAPIGPDQLERASVGPAGRQKALEGPCTVKDHHIRPHTLQHHAEAYGQLAVPVVSGIDRPEGRNKIVPFKTHILHYFHG